MSNKQNGDNFEKMLCEKMAEVGYWCHRLNPNKNGQPADIIAVKNGRAFLIDCKDCENDVFVFSRIEENQKYAMDKWFKCGNGYGCFALNTSEGIYLMPMWMVKGKQITLQEMKKKLITLSSIA